MQEKVNGPGIALMVIGGLGILNALVSIPLNLAQFRANPQLQDLPPVALYGILGFVTLLFISVSVLVLMGGMKMRSLQSRSLVMAASILAMIPCCVGLCCVPGIPVGIWSLVVMNDPQVKAAFTS